MSHLDLDAIERELRIGNRGPIGATVTPTTALALISELRAARARAPKLERVAEVAGAISRIHGREGDALWNLLRAALADLDSQP